VKADCDLPTSQDCGHIAPPAVQGQHTLQGSRIALHIVLDEWRAIVP